MIYIGLSIITKLVSSICLQSTQTCRYLMNYHSSSRTQGVSCSVFLLLLLLLTMEKGISRPWRHSTSQAVQRFDAVDLCSHYSTRLRYLEAG